MYKKILVAYSATLESRCVLHECIRLAPGPEASIHLLAVVMPPPPIIGGSDVVVVFNQEEDVEVEKSRVRDELAVAHRFLSDAGLHITSHLEVGEPVDVIGTLASQLGAELVIVGHSRHKSWAARWWRGSTDAMLIERVQCSLLVARVSQE